MANLPNFMPLPMSRISKDEATASLNQLFQLFTQVRQIPGIDLDVPRVDDAFRTVRQVRIIEQAHNSRRKYPRTFYELFPYFGIDRTVAALDLGVSPRLLTNRALTTAGHPQWRGPPEAGQFMIAVRHILNTWHRISYHQEATQFDVIREEISANYNQPVDTFTLMYATGNTYVPILNQEGWINCFTEYKQTNRYRIDFLLYPNQMFVENLPPFIPAPLRPISKAQGLEALDYIQRVFRDNIIPIPFIDIDGAEINHHFRVIRRMRDIQQKHYTRAKFPRTNFELFPYIGTDIATTALQLGVTRQLLRNRAHGEGIGNWPGEPPAGQFLIVAKNIMNDWHRFWYYQEATNFETIINNVAMSFNQPLNTFTLLYASGNAYLPIEDQNGWITCFMEYQEASRYRIDFLVYPH